MVKKKTAVNFGVCQGIVRGSVFIASSGIALFDVRVKSNRKNPKTKKYEMHILNFVARGRMADEAVRSLKDGAVVFLNYHLEERISVNRNSGVSRFFQDRVVDQICVRSPEDEGAPGYTNHGLLRCKFIGITKIATAEGIHELTVLFDDPVGRILQHFTFVVYGVLGDSIERRFKKGQTVTIEYKVEKSKRSRFDGRTDYYTNLVLEKIA